jgi:hypothetical protein
MSDRPKIRAVHRGHMALSHLQLAEKVLQPRRLEHQRAAHRQMTRALKSLEAEMEADR